MGTCFVVVQRSCGIKRGYNIQVKTECTCYTVFYLLFTLHVSGIIITRFQKFYVVIVYVNSGIAAFYVLITTSYVFIIRGVMLSV
jgi:hypothetical protein